MSRTLFSNVKNNKQLIKSRSKTINTGIQKKQGEVVMYNVQEAV